MNAVAESNPHPRPRPTVWVPRLPQGEGRTSMAMRAKIGATTPELAEVNTSIQGHEPLSLPLGEGLG